jgi:hypothetical protein
MTIINGRILFFPSKINKSIKLNIKNIALSLFIVLSFFLSHLRIAVIYKSTNNYPTMCLGYKQKTPRMWGLY